MPHHGRLGPRSPGKEKPESGSQMVSYEGPITRSRAEFINLVTHLDDEKAFGSLEGSRGGQFWRKTKKGKLCSMEAR